MTLGNVLAPLILSLPGSLDVLSCVGPFCLRLKLGPFGPSLGCGTEIRTLSTLNRESSSNLLDNDLMVSDEFREI